MKTQILISLIYSILFLSNFITGELVRKYCTKFQEISRKVVHIISGLLALSFPYYITSHWTVAILAAVFCFVMLITKRNNMLNSIHNIDRKSYGSFYYPLAIYVIFLLASNKPVIYFISILVMTISDAFAALVGKKYGSIKFEIEGSSKSLEGSVSFLFITFLCVLIPLLLMSQIENLQVILISLIISILLTSLEAISPVGSDNLIIPFGTYFILMKLSNISLNELVYDVYALLGIIATTATLYALNVSGLIGIMLLNYAAFTLAGFYWAFPLFMTEIVLFILISSVLSNKKINKITINTIFYLGIIPTIWIFIVNTVGNNNIFFIPYLVSIVSQIPMSYSYNLKEPNKKKYLKLLIDSAFTILLVSLPACLLYYKNFEFKFIFTTFLSSFVIFVIYKLISRLKLFENNEKNEFRIRLISTIVGSIFSFFLINPSYLLCTIK